MFGQGLRQAQTQAFPDRVVDREALLADKIVVEETNAAEMTVDRLRCPSTVELIVDVVQDLRVVHLFNRDIDPQEELLQAVEVVGYGLLRIVPSLQETPVTQDRIGNVHGSHPSR